ncbi:MAG TPA: branched-chain-amino-acid transaminase [Candidatus Nitrosotenuis sp.]|jgi:branched-chain amino acid aminotransferase|nr:branched-chain-amino-acid transaminase [Candidatus Nitrosotenuis sp.]
MSLQVYIDGKFYPKEEARISVWDHGLLYGDGVFEGIRVYQGRVFRLQEHLVRLYHSARSVMIQIPLTLDEMREAVLETLRRNDLPDSYIRLLVTRGAGDLGLDPRKCTRPSIIIINDRIKLYPQECYEKGLKLIVASTRKVPVDCLNPRVKSMNYLNNILAKIEAIQAGAAEAVMLDKNGFLTECTAENIFIVKDRVLYTPTAVVGILEGITRSVVMELAAERGYQVQMAFLTMHDLYVADECFVTGTGAEILPVIEVGGRVIARGEPGPVTRELLAAFRELTRREGTPYRQPSHSELVEEPSNQGLRAPASS